MIDLHTHSTASDGTDQPEELVKKAFELGIEAIALTDHDTLNGLSKAREAALDLGMTFIGGCEISTITDMGEVHILGLWIPNECEILENFLCDLRKRRAQRNERMIQNLQRLGYAVSLEEVNALAQNNPGRPHIAQLLVQKGYAPDRESAFRELLGESGKAYVPKFAPSPAQAVRILQKLGASSFIAHPMLRKWPINWLENFIRDLAHNGMFGVEAWHSAHSKENIRFILEMASRYNLNVSGGSDYHGLQKPDIQLGTGRDNLNIPITVLESLESARKAAGLPC